MAIFLDEAKPLTIYNGAYLYPINKKNKNKGSIVYFFTPDKISSFNLLRYNMEQGKLNSSLFNSYFIEKNVEIVLNGDSKFEANKLNINNEQVEYDYNILEGLNYNHYDDDLFLSENCLMFRDKLDKYRIFSGEYIDKLLDEEIELLNESIDPSKFNSTFKKLLYNYRMKNQQEAILLYDEVKKKFPFIKYTFVDTKLYKDRNLIYDWSYYTEIFFRNKKKLKFNSDYNIELIIAFFNRFLLDTRFNSYTHKTIIIPVNDWCSPEDNVTDFKNVTNPITAILRLLFLESNILDLWKNYTIVFVSHNNKFFTLDLAEFTKTANYAKLVGNLRKLITFIEPEDAVSSSKDSKDVILLKMVNTLAQSGININNLSGATSNLTKEQIKRNGLIDNPSVIKDTEIKKAVLVNKLEKIAEKSSSEEDAMNAIEEDDEKEKEWMTQLLMDLQSEDGVKLDKVRAARHDKTQQELLKKVIKGKTVKELLEEFKSNNDIPESSIPIDNIDDHWQKVKYPNFNKMYTEEAMQADIVAMFHHFTNVTHPLNIINISSENISTSEDYVETWTVNYEDAETGKRFTMKLDLPIMVDNRFMKLRGNEKTLIGQLMLLPIVKTDNDTVQIVSNYNKIFVRRKSPSGLGKSTPIVNRLCKVLTKYEGKDIKLLFGDNRKICSKYELPISFVDMASQFSMIKFKDGSYIDFNLDNLKNIPFERASLPKQFANLPEKELENKYFACYVNKDKLKVPVDITQVPVDEYIRDVIMEYSSELSKEYASRNPAKRLMYSEASILATKIPIIIVCAYAIGLQRVLDRIGIKYEFSEKRPTKGNFFLKFNDGYLVYEARSDADHLLMNGLTQFDTEEYSISEINSKDMWLSVLDDFGGRIKADGLDNFYDLMMDPITVEICNILKIPSDYIGALLYASGLLVDNKYNKHSDITGNRLRVNEVVVGHLYQVLAKEFGTYRNMVKRNNKQAAFTAKQSAVIDSLLTHDQTSSDISTMTPILEIETANKVTFKGLSGMNSDRAFSMDKRSYDKSMLGILSQSTGFAGTVGINRQLTIDAGVLNKRGFMSATKNKDLDNLNTMCAMEALAPMTANHNDPMRNAMMFVQNVSHGMTVRKAMPSLITSGMDEALIYLTGDKFAYKFKGKQGKVIAMTEDYIIVQDTNSKKKDFIDLRETIRKNSDGGFYLTTKLSPNEGIKVGSILKENDVVAYDHKSYSPSVGHADRKNPNLLSYNLGTLSTVGILQTDLGFEDSCVVDEYVSEALAAEFCVQKEISLPPTSNIYFMVNVGEKIEEGNPLIIFTDNFEDEDANEILSSLAKDNDSFLSDIGRKQVHAKVSGKVQDIKIYRTCEISKLSPSLQKLVKSYEGKINKLKKVMKDNNIEKEHTLESTEKLDQQGKLKSVDGILIEFYIKTVDKYGVGDKLVFGPTGLKGVNSYVVPKEDAATAEYYGDREKISAFLTCSGIGARMTPSAITTGLLNKALIALTRQVQEELGIKWRSIQEIMTDFTADY